MRRLWGVSPQFWSTGRRAALALGVGIATSMGIALSAATPALAVSGPTFATSDGAVVTVQQDENGSPYWTLDVDGPAPTDTVWGWYVFSWEKNDGTAWTSPEELKAAMGAIVQCELDYFNNVIAGMEVAPEGDVYDPCISEGTIPAAAFERSTTTLKVPYDPADDGTQTVFGVGMTCNISAEAIAGWMSGGVPSVGFCDMTYSTPSFLTVRFDDATVLPDLTARDAAALAANARPSGQSNSDYQSLNPDAPPGSFFAPTVFSGLRELGLPIEEAKRLGATAGATLVLAALVALPTELINRSLDQVRLRRRRPDDASDEKRQKATGWSRFSRIVFGQVKGFLAFFMLLLASIFASAANPDFGVNWLSLRIVIGLFIGFLVINYGAVLLGWMVARKSAPGSRPRLAARPIFLIVILLTVLGARLINIEPTVIFGLILAVDFGVRISDAAEGRMAIAESIWVMFVGLTAWGLYMVTAPIAAFFGPPVTIAIGEFLSMVCVESLSVLPLLLLPASPMPGAALFRWNKWVWGVFFVIGLTVFSFVLVPMPAAWSSVNEPFVLWVALFVAYVVIAIGVWLAVRLLNRRRLESLEPTATPPRSKKAAKKSA